VPSFLRRTKFSSARGRARLSGEPEPGAPIHPHVEAAGLHLSEQGHGGGAEGVVVDENKVYFYAPVSADTVLELNQILRSLDVEMRCLSVRFGMPEPFPIELHIHSDGGDLFSGLAAADTISGLRTPVHTYVEGSAASAATLMSVCGKRRFITHSSLMLIHQLSALMVEGTHEQFRDEFINQELLMVKIKDIYRKHTRLSEDVLEELLKHDLLLDANRCLELGLVDEVV
jgi:ATP-dependent protease ClpP protease subunit